VFTLEFYRLSYSSLFYTFYPRFSSFLFYCNKIINLWPHTSLTRKSSTMSLSSV
jgi:hypothetical protein